MALYKFRIIIIIIIIIKKRIEILNEFTPKNYFSNEINSLGLLLQNDARGSVCIICIIS